MTVAQGVHAITIQIHLRVYFLPMNVTGMRFIQTILTTEQSDLQIAIT